VRATRLSRVAVIGYISQRRAAFTGMQLSQACSSHRCAALTGDASLTGVQLTRHVAHRVSDLGKRKIFGKKKVFGKTSLYVPNRKNSKWRNLRVRETFFRLNLQSPTSILSLVLKKGHDLSRGT
jgi:hypothetical protein